MNKSFDALAMNFPLLATLNFWDGPLATSKFIVYTGGFESHGNAILVKPLAFPIKSPSHDWMEW